MVYLYNVSGLNSSTTSGTTILLFPQKFLGRFTSLDRSNTPFFPIFNVTIIRAFITLDFGVLGQAVPAGYVFMASKKSLVGITKGFYPLLIRPVFLISFS